MKHLAKSVLLLLLLVALTVVGYKIYEDNLTLVNGLNDNRNLPSEIIQKYWESSAKGDFQEITDLISQPPESFWNCYFDTPDQCAEKKLTAQEKNNKQKSEDGKFKFEADINDDKDFVFLIIKNQIPKGINEGGWRGYSIKQQWIYGDEARIRILISDEDTFLERDVLLTKSNDTWKIFRFADIGDRAAYAPPK